MSQNVHEASVSTAHATERPATDLSMRRRILLDCLRRRSGAVSLQTLAEDVLERECGPDAAADPERLRRVKFELHHSDLGILDEMDAATYAHGIREVLIHA